MESNAKRRMRAWLAGATICHLSACSVPGGDGIVGTGVIVPKTSTQGPYIKSFELVSHALNGDGSRLGDTRLGQYDTPTATVQLSTDRTGPVLLVNNGSHLNEITGKWSEQWLSLRTVHVFKKDETSRVAFNTMTHITHKRVLKLMSFGVSVETAHLVAEQEAMSALQDILMPVDGGFSVTEKKESLSALRPVDAYVAALSAVMRDYANARYARRTASSPDSELAYLLNAMAVWLRDSKPIPREVLDGLRDASHRVRPDIVRDILIGHGVWSKNLSAPSKNPLDTVLDTDGDGKVNEGDDDIDGDGVPNLQDSSPYSVAAS